MIKGILQEMLSIIKDNKQDHEVRIKLIEGLTTILVSEEFVSKLRKVPKVTNKPIVDKNSNVLKPLPKPLPIRPRVTDITLLEELQEAISTRRISIDGPKET